MIIKTAELTGAALDWAVAKPENKAVIEQAIEWIEAQPEPRMIGAAKIITGLRQLLEQHKEKQNAS